jgi:hypothetical protein
MRVRGIFPHLTGALYQVAGKDARCMAPRCARGDVVFSPKNGTICPLCKLIPNDAKIKKCDF